MDVPKELNTFIADELSAGEVDPDDDLIELGLIDSFGILELLDFIDQRFGVSLPPDEVIPENFQSVRSITTLIETKLA